MRIVKNVAGSKSWYLQAGPRLNKSLEAGWTFGVSSGFSLSISLNFRGRDHAGLRCIVRLFKTLFEFSVTDQRHWNFVEDRFCLPHEEPVFTGYPHE